MKDHLKQHSKNGGWVYQRGVPRDVRDLYDKPRQTIEEYIGIMSRTAAAGQARAYAVRDDNRFKRLRSLTQGQREELKALGGYPSGLKRNLAALDEIIRLMAEGKEWTAKIDPRRDAASAGMTVEQMALFKDDHTNDSEIDRADRADFQRRRALAAKIEPEATAFSFDALFAMWVDAMKPKATRHALATIKLFRDFVGHDDYRKVAPDDVARFRDYMDAQGMSWSVQSQHKNNLSRMYSAAVSRVHVTGQKTNPVKGVLLEIKKPKGKRKQPWSGEQLRIVLAKAAETRFGDGLKKRHVATLWLIKLAIFTGCRINEAAQLRTVDVYPKAGVDLLHFREGHPQQSIKTGEERFMPLHPAIRDDFLAYVAACKTDFIFDAFPHVGEKDENGVISQGGGRANWLINNFPRFVRDDCGLVPDRQSLNSCRHRFIDAMRNAGVPEDQRKELVGNGGGIHGQYGHGTGLLKLAKAVADSDPLSDL